MAWLRLSLGTLVLGSAALLFAGRKTADAQAPSAAPASPSCPAEMAAIPGGTYTMGDRGDGTPRARATVAPYCMDRTEVTVTAYAACVTAGSCTAPDAYNPALKDSLHPSHCTWNRSDRTTHPVNCVDWNQATTYCGWAGKRLPTDEEWEWAARNGPAGTVYPWGATRPDVQLGNFCSAECNYYGGKKTAPADGFPETAPVGSFARGDNHWGVHDLAGNVEEWTSTADVSLNKPVRAVRGGDWQEVIDTTLDPGAEIAARAIRRFTYRQTDRNDLVGFRCTR